MKNKHIIRNCIIILLLVILCILGYYHKAVYMVFKNLTASTKNIDTGDEWNNGESYLNLPYAEDSETQYLDLYVPYTEDGSKPWLFVLVHGGGFITNDSQSRQAQLMYRYFRDNGYACATVNYRLAQEEPFPGAVCDVKAAVRFLKAHSAEYGYDASKVAIWGESAGGYLAVIASVTNDDEFMDVNYIGQEEYEAEVGAASAKVDVCVDYYGCLELGIKDDDWNTLKVPGIIIDIANSWLHTDVLDGYSDVESFWLRKETESMTADESAYSDIYAYAKENLSEDSDMKFWIAHGNCDITVPILQSDRFYSFLCEAIGEENVVYNIVEGAGHAGDIMYSDVELLKIKQYLDGEFNLYYH